MTPLTSRNINVQSSSFLQTDRPARDIVPKEHTPRLGSRRDENLIPTPLSASPKAPLSRLLSQTKASAARAGAASSHQQTPLSRLPRRAETPNSARTVISKVGQRNTQMATVKRGAPSGGSTTLETSRRTANATDIVYVHSRSKNHVAPPLPDKPWPVDKALPPRPVATFANAMSPSKDSRSLIDATERPLRRSPDNPDEAEWPPLSPIRQSATAPCLPQSLTNITPYAYATQYNLKSHWSVDTPDTPASTMPPTMSFDERDEFDGPSSLSPQVPSGYAHRSSSLLNLTGSPTSSSVANSRSTQPPRSPTMIDLHALEPRARSISVTDRTSNGAATVSTVDTTELTNESTQLTQDSERPHSPPPYSFSQPRLSIRRSSLPGTPMPQNSLNKKHGSKTKQHATASRIPIYDPRKTPNLVDIKPRTPAPTGSCDTSDRAAIPTFGGRRLDTPADLAALDKDHCARRQPSSRTLRQTSADQFGLAKKVSLANMKNQVRRLTPSPAPSEQAAHRATRKSSASSTIPRELSSSRVRNLSGQLHSGSFHGSTLTIHNEADDFLLNTPERGKMADQYAALNQLNRHATVTQHVSGPQDAAAAMSGASELQVELSLAFDAPNQHSPIARRTMRAPIAELIAANEGRGDTLPGATIRAQDADTDKQITATLSILEGTPPSVRPTANDFVEFVNNYGKLVSPRIPSPTEGHERHTSGLGRASSSPAMVYAPDSPCPQRVQRSGSLSISNLEGESTRSQNQRPGERVPSYMNSTPASEARRVSKSQLRDDLSIGYPNHISYKASRVLGTGENDNPQRTLTGKRTLAQAADLKIGRSGHTLPTQFPEIGGKWPGSHAPPATAAAAPAPQIYRRGGVQVQTKQKTRARSESKSRFINNFKGLFSSSKRDVNPPDTAAATAAGKRHIRHEQLSREATSNPDGTIVDHDKSALRVTSPGSPTPLTPSTGKPLPDPQSLEPHVYATKSPISPYSPASHIPSPRYPANQLVNITRALMDEAGREDDGAKHDSLVCLAKVILDTVSNSTEAERSMVIAQQAAEAARMSYEMTQKSVAELGRLIHAARGNGVASVLRKVAAKSGQ